MTVVALVGTTDLAEALEAAERQVECVDDLADAQESAEGFDCLVVDADELGDPGEAEALTGSESFPVVVVGDGVDAGAVLDAGATDYVLRDAPASVLATRVESAAEAARRGRWFDAVFDDAPRPVGIFDDDGSAIRRNRTARAFDPDDAGGERFWNRAWVDRSPVDEAVVRSAFEGALAGEPQRIPAEIADSEGTVRSMLVELRPVTEDGIVTAVAAEAIPADHDALPGDATDLAPVSRQLRTVVDNLPIVVFALDETGTFTLSEGKGLARLGLDPSDLVGENVFEMYGDNEAMTDACRRALDGEEVTVVLEVGDSAFETWYQPVTEDGEVTQVLGAAIDVTDLKKRERELEQYETIIETVPDGVFVIDEDGVILNGNRVAADMLGYDPEDLLGENFYQLTEAGVVDPSMLGDYQDVVRDLLSSRTDTEQGRLEYTVDRPDGDRRVFETHLALRPYDEEFRGVVGVVRDVTDRKRTEQELRRQNERLEKLASVVSHDLRNPLNVAQGLTELLATDYEDERFDDLESALDRMQQLVAELLQLARTGETVTDPEYVALADLARDAWSTVSVQGADLQLDVEYGASVDRSRVRQLFENLFRNAVEHGSTSPGSQTRQDAVEHGVRDVTVTVDDLPDEVGFYVADDGAGIPEDQREEVFEYGFTTSEEGTGLGLAIVREIAEAHGWDVTVTEAGGARFEFRESLDAT